MQETFGKEGGEYLLLGRSMTSFAPLERYLLPGVHPRLDLPKLSYLWCIEDPVVRRSVKVAKSRELELKLFLTPV